MRYFLSIMQGDSPGTAKPVVATEDPAVIHAAAEALAGRLGVLTPAALRDLTKDHEGTPTLTVEEGGGP